MKAIFVLNLFTFNCNIIVFHYCLFRTLRQKRQLPINQYITLILDNVCEGLYKHLIKVSDPDS